MKKGVAAGSRGGRRPIFQSVFKVSSVQVVVDGKE